MYISLVASDEVFAVERYRLVVWNEQFLFPLVLTDAICEPRCKLEVGIFFQGPILRMIGGHASVWQVKFMLLKPFRRIHSIVADVWILDIDAVVGFDDKDSFLEANGFLNSCPALLPEV